MLYFLHHTICMILLIMAISTVGLAQDTIHRPVPVGCNYSYLPWFSTEKEAAAYCEATICNNYLDTLEHLGCQHDCYMDGFYPIGWSKSGAFAYVHYQDDGEGLTDYTIKVIDSPKRKMKGKTYATAITPVEDYNDISHLWQAAATDIQSFLDNNQIYPNTGKFSPISFAKDKLKLIHRKQNQNGSIYAYEIALYIGNNEVVLHTWENTQQEIQTVELVGWFASPYSSKVALLLAYTTVSPQKNKNHTFKLVMANWKL